MWEQRKIRHSKLKFISVNSPVLNSKTYDLFVGIDPSELSHIKEVMGLTACYKYHLKGIL